ncbi:MAG: DMT family transporter [Chloroflexi bacterium]|nr:DMT family transporter [Chloroflexota bacterium]
MHPPETYTKLGLLAGLLASAIWGGMYVVSKVVLEVIPPFTLLSFRLVLGTLALGLWLAWRRKLPKLDRSQWLGFLGVGVLGYAVSLGLQFLGTRLSNASNAAVVTSATPAFVYLFAAILLHEKFSRRRLLALVLSTFGVIAVIDPGRAALLPELWRGNLILVLAAITWALYSVLARKATQELGALSFTFVALIGGLLASVPLAFWEFSQNQPMSMNASIFAGVLYLGLISTALAAWLWNLAFERLEAGLASLTSLLNPW